MSDKKEPDEVDGSKLPPITGTFHIVLPPDALQPSASEDADEEEETT